MSDAGEKPKPQDEVTWRNNISSINISDFVDDQEGSRSDTVHYLDVKCRGKL